MSLHHGPAQPVLIATHVTVLKERIAARLRTFTEAYRDGLPALHSPARCGPCSLLVPVGPQSIMLLSEMPAEMGAGAANKGPSLPTTQHPRILPACCPAASRACLLPTPELLWCCTHSAA